MNVVALSLLFALTVVAISYAETNNENCVTFFEGCKISKGQCLCGEMKGCKNTYPYKDREECEKEIKGNNDPCKKNHCKHGLCVQTSRDGTRSYKCDCTASGFFGSKCQHSCEDVEAGKANYPAECVDIF